MTWKDIVKIMDRPKPAPQRFRPEIQNHPQKERSKSKSKARVKAIDRPDVRVEDETSTDVAPQTKDECVCRNPMCNMRATWKCKKCSHRACDIHKAIIESFWSPRTGESAKLVHGFELWDCKTNTVLSDRSQMTEE